MRGVADECGSQSQSADRLYSGRYGNRLTQNETLLTKLMSRETVDILDAGRETTEQYARLFVQVKRAGTPMPDNDLWIAA